MAGGARLSPDEFAGLHEQLLQLKMQNSELEEGNRPLRALAGGGAGPGPPPPAPGGPALGGAPAAGARTGAAASSARAPASAGGGDAAAACGEDGAEEARQEVVSLRQRLRKATEELAAARSDMRASQQAAMVAQTAAAKAAGLLPDVGEVRRRLVAKDDQADLEDADDTAVLRIATASFRLAPRPEPLACGGGSDQGPGGAPGAGGAGPASAQEDRNMLALQRIQSQQKDLERLRLLADTRQATVKGLQEQAVTCRASQAADKQQLLEDKLRSTERDALELARRLGAADDATGQAFELQCHLRAMTDKVRQREQAIEKTRALRERQDASLARLREGLALALEDARGHWAEREEACASGAEASAPGAMAEAPAVAPPAAAAGTSVGAQVDLGAEGDCPEVSLEALEARLQAAQEERAALEKRSADEVQELRGLVRSRQRLQQAAADAAAAEADGRAGGEGDLPDGRVVGSLYNQKILELEELNGGLEGDLQLLQASLQCLRADLAAKEDLISDLMRSAVGAGDGPAAHPPKKDGVLSQLWGLGGRKDESRKHHEVAEHAELKRLAEAACLDNMRLRRDLQSIGEEYRKTIEGRSKAGAER